MPSEKQIAKILQDQPDDSSYYEFCESWPLCASSKEDWPTPMRGERSVMKR